MTKATELSTSLIQITDNIRRHLEESDKFGKDIASDLAWKVFIDAALNENTKSEHGLLSGDPDTNQVFDGVQSND